MRVTRVDLDGKGKGSPEGIVTAILAIEKDLPIPVPIEALCAQLDISEIANLETDAFEGGLLTDTTRSSGIILVNANRQRQRRRFTIGHELGHFLIPTHMPSADGRFLCSRDDMRMLTARENDRRARMEVEANRFSSLILIPPPALRKNLKDTPKANLAHLAQLARRYDVSKEAMARAYANYHSDVIAIIVCKDGKILRSYRNRTAFPFIQPSHGERVPGGSLYHRAGREVGAITDFCGCVPDIWIDVERGKRAPILEEQVHIQQEGYALILLKLEKLDEDEEDEEQMLQGRWHVGFKT
jgi:hypothetical protein